MSGERVKVGNKEFIINSHKPREIEQLIYQLKFITPLTKLVTLASENQLVRGLCFISHNKLVIKDYDADEKNDGESENPPRFALPLGFDTIHKDTLSKKIEVTNEIAEEAEKTLESFYDVMIETFRTSLMRTVQSQARKELGSSKRRKTKKTVMEIWENQAHRAITKEIEKRRDEMEIFSKLTNAQQMTPNQVYRTMSINEGLKSLIEDFDSYKKIYDHLKKSSNYKKPREIYEALKTISGLEISYGNILNAVCLNPKCNYSAIHYGTIPALERCPMCGGDVLTFLSCTLDDQVNSAWELNVLQEMIIAYILLKRKWVKKIWLHKSLNQKINGKFSKSIPSDLIVQTEDDEILLIDVTTQADLSNIVRDLNKKWERLSKSGLEFDGFMCVSSATPLPKYINPVGQAWLFGTSHIDKIFSHIEYIYENKIRKLPVSNK